MTTLSGLVPVLATPFSSDGDLDRKSLARLVEFELASGTDGIALFGMASETFALDSGERATILQDVIATTHKQAASVPVVAGIAPTGLAPAIEQARPAIEAGADALMVLPPYLVPATGQRLIDFYGQLAQRVQVPIMVQDAPATTGVVMDTDLIAQLSKLPHVDYVKIEAHPTAPKIESVSNAVGGNLRVFGGQNAQFLLEELHRGAIGTMPACEFTDFLGEILAAYRAGELSLAVDGFTRLLPVLNYGLQSGIAWAVHKEVLVRRGIIESSRVRLPAISLDRGSYDGLLRLLAPLEAEASWRSWPAGA